MNNQLLTRQQHYLLGVSEECDEVSQRVIKALRFGLDEIQMGQDLDNKQRILYEVNDLFAMLELTFGFPIGILIDKEAMDAKKEKFEKYLQYCKSIGTLNE